MEKKRERLSVPYKFTSLAPLSLHFSSFVGLFPSLLIYFGTENNKSLTECKLNIYGLVVQESIIQM